MKFCSHVQFCPLRSMTPPRPSAEDGIPAQTESSLSKQQLLLSHEMPQQLTTRFSVIEALLPHSMATASLFRTVQSSTQQPSPQRMPPPAPPTHSTHSTTQPAPVVTACPSQPRMSHSLTAQPLPVTIASPVTRMKWLASTQHPFPQRTPPPLESATTSS